jgi:hypothetical protein
LIRAPERAWGASSRSRATRYALDLVAARIFAAASEQFQQRIRHLVGETPIDRPARGEQAVPERSEEQLGDELEIDVGPDLAAGAGLLTAARRAMPSIVNAE